MNKGGDERLAQLEQSSAPLIARPDSFYYSDLQAGRGTMYRAFQTGIWFLVFASLLGLVMTTGLPKRKLVET